MIEEYVPSEFVSKYLDYLKYERKLSDNTLASYSNDLKDLDIYKIEIAESIKLQREPQRRVLPQRQQPPERPWQPQPRQQP